MARSEALFALTLLCLFGHALSTLRCYDCNAHQDGKCLDPVSDAKSSVCEPSGLSTSAGRSFFKNQINDIDRTDIEPRARGRNLTFECYSVYFESNDTDGSGVFRGCIDVDLSIRSTCEFLPEVITGGNITKCTSCNMDNCNVHDVGGGAAIFSLSLGLLIVNMIICMNVLEFS